MDWILASASPRRRELLAELMDSFMVLPSQGEEIVEGNPTPKELVKMLALQKATEVARRAECKEKAVIGSDTVVALDGKILGKPKDEADAVVSVDVPVSVLIKLCALSGNDKVTGGVMVKSAYNVKESRFTASRRTEYGNELLLSAGNTYTLKRLNRFRGCDVILLNIL